MTPVAYGLLAFMPWQWEELLDRATVAEVEQVVHGAHWRMDALVWQPCAWQTAHLMAAAGSKPRSAEEVAMLPPATETSGWTADKLLGRAPIPLDAQAAEPPAESPPPPDDGRPDWDAATRREKAERARLMIAMAQAQKATD
jgi:hypothetical protein